MSKTQSREQLERHVLGAVIGFMKAQAAETGRSHWDMVGDAQVAFPGIPPDVVWQAIFELDEEHAEAWWDSLAKTIEGELVRNALSLRQSAEAGEG